MNLIEKKAELFNARYLRGNIGDYKKVLLNVPSELSQLRDVPDRILFLTAIMTANDKAYKAHLPKCTNPVSCPINYNHESLQYALETELNNLGVQTNDDAFTVEEHAAAENKLDAILAELEHLKMGQEIVYDQIDAAKAEMAELRNLYIFGKKKWTQLFLGKTTEMVISGVVSETVSKKLVQMLVETFPRLIS